MAWRGAAAPMSSSARARACATAAGTRGQSIHGEGTPTYTFQIDGIQANASDQNYPENSVDMETVQEVDFVTGGVDSSAYGSRSGFMNVVTKSGGNSFHGSAVLYGRKSAADHRLGRTAIGRRRRQADVRPLQL